MIRIENVNKNYKKKQVLFDISLNIDIHGHSIIGLIGPNGAGKTTFIKVMAGLLDYSSGKISVDNSNSYKEWCKENVVLIPAGERGLRYKNTVYDNVMYFAAMKGVAENKVKSLMYEYASLLNYTDFLNRRVETLSMGEKKKAMLLCGLCTDMKVIIMDEPSNGLDVDARIEMEMLIKMLSTKLNKIFLISSHDIGFLGDIAGRYIFIFKGKKVAEVENAMEATEIYDKYTRLKTNLGGNNEDILKCN